MNEKHKKGDNRFDSGLGDAYTFVGIEADTKLVPCLRRESSERLCRTGTCRSGRGNRDTGWE